MYVRNAHLIQRGRYVWKMTSYIKFSMLQAYISFHLYYNLTTLFKITNLEPEYNLYGRTANECCEICM